MTHGQCDARCTVTFKVNSALHLSGVDKPSTSFGWGKGENVTSAGWQVTLCDPMWHVSSRSSVATLRTAIHLLLIYLLTYLPSRRALPPIDRYQIILLDDKGTRVNNLPKVVT